MLWGASPGRRQVLIMPLGTRRRSWSSPHPGGAGLEGEMIREAGSGWTEPQLRGGVGRCPLSGARPPPGWGTNPALIAHRCLRHAVHVWTHVAAGGQQRGESPKKTEGEGWTRWGVCPAGGERGGWEDLKTTRINRFMYQEQARVSPAK